MFAHAVKLVSEFTRPVLISIRHASGKIETGCGTYILLNSDGWALTAGHSIGALLKHQTDKPKYDDYCTGRKAIEGDKSLSVAKKKQKLRALKLDPTWVTHVSYWWGGDRITHTMWHFAGVADLAAVRLANCDFSVNQGFAQFGDSSVELPQGTSLCKLGFPFHEFKTDFDDTTQSFVIKELPPLVRYPLDGILTRYNVFVGPEGQQTVKFAEMSTPGLRGQSGGPWFDVNGTVWGVQSRTHHLPLGFSPEIEIRSKKVTEHQFLNSGAATYINEIAAFLDRHKIAFDKAVLQRPAK
jgi:hypothetical protein